MLNVTHVSVIAIINTQKLFCFLLTNRNIKPPLPEYRDILATSLDVLYCYS